ncbi:hypothetical protein BH23PLA1_BH23PLA1_36090 [soil metagenome]
MRLPLASVLAAGFALATAYSAMAQDAKKNDGEPEQYAVYDGYVWKAWATKGEEGKLHVAGIIKGAGSPGEVPYLVPANPQGINLRILILEVKRVELPGPWPDVLVDLPTSYQQAGVAGEYDSIQVRLRGQDEIHLLINVGGEEPRADGQDKK